MDYNPTLNLLNASRSPETRRIVEIIEQAKIQALGGSAMHAKMLMNILLVEGGKETLWALTTAAQRRDIKYLADQYKPVAKPGALT